MTEEAKGVWKILQGLWESSWPFLLALSIICGFPLFAPDSLLEFLGILELKESVHSYLGAGFIIFVSLLLARFVQWLSNIGTNKRQIRKYQKLLHKLSPEEKAVLKQFLDKDTKTVTLDMSSGVAGGLRAQHVLYPSTNIGVGGTYLDHNIQPWAWDNLKKHPKLLEGSREEDDADPDDYLTRRRGRANW